MRRPTLALALSLLLLPIANATHAADAAPPAPLTGLDAQVESVREAFKVPGVAVAVVKDGELVFAGGWGEREVGKAEVVDADTLFSIASITKAFTSASLSILADEGKLDMDDRVIDHLPWFRMDDAYVTREMRIRDLLVHRSGLGLGAGDLLFWPPSDYSTRDVVERLARVPIAGGFRDRYAYDNVLYAVAQLVIEGVSGQAYADFVRERLFQPVGMGDTRIDSNALRPTDTNVATGHARAGFTGEPEPVPAMSWSNNTAAGGIYSSVNDMAKWMRVQLDGGVLEGEGEDAKRLFSEKRHEAMWSLVTPIPIRKPTVPELAATKPNFAGYGEAWSLSDYRGRRLVWHTGGWPGMVSRLTLVPELDLGVVVLTNQETGAAFNAITMHVLDAYMEAPATDWVAAYAAAIAKGGDRADEDWKKHVAARDARSKPALPLSGYAATYRDPWYGDVVLAQGSKGLEMRFARTPQLVGDLEHWQHDSFIVRWRDRTLNADAFVDFSLDHDGKVREARMEAVSPLTDFSFDFHDLRLKPVEKKGSSPN
ncbi:serine hydrolase [Luteimonas terricola]|uniref:Serine hydrolase n=1 Tax=Luteimonas terricola TaxID=645597 RepID=A0ABQ2EG49_9GAMM|nr:serine hydrolase [Luteimonas terricola]GGK10491.1 serine hydrolase [Luteimonas terricola]